MSEEPKHPNRCVRVQQLKCPNNHAILCAAYVSPDGEPVKEAQDRTRAKLDSVMAANGVLPLCNICLAPRETWTWDDRPTGWQTLNDAEAALMVEALKQRVAAMLIEAERKLNAHENN